METAKIDSELEAPESGVVAHIMVPEGTTVDVGTIVAVIAEPGETVPRPTSIQPRRVPAPAKRRSPGAGATTGRGAVADRSGQAAQVTPVARRLARQENVDLSQVQGTGPGGRITEDDVRSAIETSRVGPPVQVVPRARMVAKEQGIDLSQVQGTGPDGRILVVDVESAIAAQAAGQVGEAIPLKGLRKTIADRMMESVHSMAHVTLTTEADVTEAVRLREDLVSQWREHRIRPLDLDLIVKATAAALREHPRLNATLVGQEIRLLGEVNVGVAMAVPDGLMVPVIRQADEKDLLSIAGEIRELVNKSRDGKLSVDDVTGSTFTITSLASYDIDAFTPIIDPPKVAILGVGRIAQKPAVYQG